ncbi:cytochrome c [Actibacterium sp.]|uniref:c-type cytochrome n=1 Tax=Actibacterium sp. TaxID=1872125 RepID=UPI003562ECD7
MSVLTKCAATALALGLSTSGVFAASPDAKMIEGAIKARKAVMTLNAANIGVLVAMAKGDAAYDADHAGKAAKNLDLLSDLSIGSYFPPDSDSMSVEGTRAMPELWDNLPDVAAKSAALNTAVDALVLAASTDLEALRGAIGPVGAACGACHKAYRTPE